MSERHTRQGTQKPTSGTRRSGRLGRSEHLPVIAAGGCWCGEEIGHDWPSKSEGAPHPR